MEMKNAVDGLLDTSRKESLSLKRLSRNLQNSSAKRKKMKKQNRIFKNSRESYNKRCTV